MLQRTGGGHEMSLQHDGGLHPVRNTAVDTREKTGTGLCFVLLKLRFAGPFSASPEPQLHKTVSRGENDSLHVVSGVCMGEELSRGEE